jgi:hypothetical protein
MSRGRYSRTWEIFVDLPDELVARIRDTVAQTSVFRGQSARQLNNA